MLERYPASPAVSGAFWGQVYLHWQGTFFESQVSKAHWKAQAFCWAGQSVLVPVRRVPLRVSEVSKGQVR